MSSSTQRRTTCSIKRSTLYIILYGVDQYRSLISDISSTVMTNTIRILRVVVSRVSVHLRGLFMTQEIYKGVLNGMRQQVAHACHVIATLLSCKWFLFYIFFSLSLILYEQVQ